MKLTKEFYKTQIASLATLGDYLDFATHLFEQADLFYGHGSDNAWDDAVFLILDALAIPLDADQSITEKIISAEEQAKIYEVLEKRINQRLPACYITNKAFFAGLEFYVDEQVLIPRSPLAEIIENHFQPWIDSAKINSILEIGTGSGCIAIACAHYLPGAKITATDIDSNALAIAEKNCQKFNVTQHVTLIQSDLFQEIPLQKFDIIISNPPYVPNQVVDELPAEYQHEPSLALRSGDDGLFHVRQMLQQARNYLSSHGILIVEVGLIADAVAEAYPQLPFIWLDFERGGEGVFLLFAKDLGICSPLLAQ